MRTEIQAIEQPVAGVAAGPDITPVEKQGFPDGHKLGRAEVRKRGKCLITELVRLLLHSIQHSNDGFILLIQGHEKGFIHIMARMAEFKPALRFRCFLHGIRQLVAEDCRIFSLSPSFCQIGAYCP